MPGQPLQEYSFSNQAGERIRATVLEGENGRIVLLDPFLSAAEANLRLASRAAVERLCPGVTHLESGTRRNEQGVQSLYWIVEESGEEYFISPIHESEGRLIMALGIRVEPADPH